MSPKSSTVFFAALSDSASDESIMEKIRLLCDATGMDTFIKKKDLTAIKTHFGEKGNVTHINPAFIRVLVDRIKGSGGRPYLTETSVLYKSQRSNALSHILLAFEHGFTFENIGAPIIMSDGFLGNWEKEIKIGGEFYDSVSVAGDAISSDKLVMVSHVTGHMLSGMGATFKNMGMGLSSRKGKLNQHSNVAPKVNDEACEFCNLCIKWCPEDAVIKRNDKAYIIEEQCIGCGECLTVCKQGAVTFQWDSTSEILQKKMVEHAYGIFLEKQNAIVYFNFMINMTKDCDCMASKEKLVEDIGILASFDPVAIDKATLDLTKKAHHENIAELAYPQRDAMVQINHAIKLGMGNPEYKLIEI
ncbi:DUF362 domain-containing protein [bacterium]|nr:DUF362 domain-containing protein [bacterium]